VPWDLAIIDEAHKLRNAYRSSNVLGQAIKWVLEDTKKKLEKKFSHKPEIIEGNIKSIKRAFEEVQG